MMFVGSVCGQREPRKLQELSCSRTIVTLFFMMICWTILSLAVVRPSTMSCSNSRIGILTAAGFAVCPDKNTELHLGIAVCRCGEDISFA